MNTEKTAANVTAAPDPTLSVTGTSNTGPSSPANVDSQAMAQGLNTPSAPPQKSAPGGPIASISKFLTGPGLGSQERLDLLSKELDGLGLAILPKNAGSANPSPSPVTGMKPDPVQSSQAGGIPTGAPRSSLAPAQPQGGIYAQAPPAPGAFAAGGAQPQGMARLNYKGRLPVIGTDRFTGRDEKSLRDFCKNINRHLPLESILDRFVDFLSSPDADGKVKHFTEAEIKQKLGCLLPESALVTYDALVRDTAVDLNAMWYTLCTRYGSYKKIDRIRENIEAIINDMSTPVMEILESLESQYNSVEDLPISKVQEEALYMAMRFLKRRLGAGFAQSVKMARLSYNVQSLRDLILLLAEEFAAIIKEGEEKDLQTRVEKAKFHQEIKQRPRLRLKGQYMLYMNITL